MHLGLQSGTPVPAQRSLAVLLFRFTWSLALRQGVDRGLAWLGVLRVPQPERSPGRRVPLDLPCTATCLLYTYRRLAASYYTVTHDSRSSGEALRFTRLQPHKHAVASDVHRTEQRLLFTPTSRSTRQVLRLAVLSHFTIIAPRHEKRAVDSETRGRCSGVSATAVCPLRDVRLPHHIQLMVANSLFRK